MLLEFLYELRRRKLAVGLQEWMALMEALGRGLHESTLTGFYHLARALLCHSEASFDAFDQAFLACFQGLEAEALEITAELEAWLRDPALLAYLSPEERAALEALTPEELRRLLAERLQEQKERHEGGNRWIGTGGTSPFGQGGFHPTGMKLGHAGGGRGAVLLAAERRFQAYRNDLTLDVRQIQVALRRLRELRRDGRDDELDLERTIDRTCRNAGELELTWRAPRRNNVKVLLLMDVGGSMDPHAEVVSQLFSAAAQSKHFRDFHAFYFHNCIYEEVYRDARMRDALPVSEVLNTYGPNYKVVLVGDAMMASW
ncbi:MAG TPA: VWA domain-containing protein, partial [Polyangia bacterium]